jgi:hypothetical protein
MPIRDFCGGRFWIAKRSHGNRMRPFPGSRALRFRGVAEIREAFHSTFTASQKKSIAACSALRSFPAAIKRGRRRVIHPIPRILCGSNHFFLISSPDVLATALVE